MSLKLNKNQLKAITIPMSYNYKYQQLKYQPLNKRFYKAIEDQNWGRNTKVMGNTIVSTKKNFGGHFSIVHAKKLLGQVQPLVMSPRQTT